LLAVLAGVRNYQARNNMMEMKVGDQALFYHSNTKIPGVVGTCEVVRESYADETAWDPSDAHFDPKTDKSKPRWFKVDIRYKSHLPRKVSLAEMKADVTLKEMQLFTRARLSVCELTKAEWMHVSGLADFPEPLHIAAAVATKRASPKGGRTKGKGAARAAAAASAGASASPKGRKAAAGAKKPAAFTKFAATIRDDVVKELSGTKAASSRAVASKIAAQWKALSVDEQRSYE
jgi:predicted RNA-binding protein with PUA-like domain